MTLLTIHKHIIEKSDINEIKKKPPCSLEAWHLDREARHIFM